MLTMHYKRPSHGVYNMPDTASRARRLSALERAHTGVCIYDGARVHVYPYSEPCPAVRLAPLCDGKRDGAVWTETPADVLDSYVLYDGDGKCVHRPR